MDSVRPRAQRVTYDDSVARENQDGRNNIIIPVVSVGRFGAPSETFTVTTGHPLSNPGAPKAYAPRRDLYARDDTDGREHGRRRRSDALGQFPDTFRDTLR